MYGHVWCSDYASGQLLGLQSQSPRAPDIIHGPGRIGGIGAWRERNGEYVGAYGGYDVSMFRSSAAIDTARGGGGVGTCFHPAQPLALLVPSHRFPAHPAQQRAADRIEPARLVRLRLRLRLRVPGPGQMKP